jgi:hypothetical protein
MRSALELMRTVERLILSMSYEANDVRSSPGKNSDQIVRRQLISNFNHYSVLQLSATRPPFHVFPSPPSAALRNDSCATANATYRVFSMFFWGLTQATTAPEDAYTALSPAKSRRRSEPPTPLRIDSGQNRRTRLPSGAADGWDLKEVYEDGRKQGEEVTGPVREEDEQRRPRMGRQRSISAGEVLREREFVYPGGRGVRAGGDAEEVEEERSVRLQGVPPVVRTGTEMRMGMGRQRSRSAEERLRSYPRPHPQPQPHQQQEARPVFESVYPGVGMRVGAARGERSMGLES